MIYLKLYTQEVVSFISLLTVIGQVLCIVLAGLLIRGNTQSSLYKWVAKEGLRLMLIVALIAVSGSLFFSEIAGWAPCSLCWYQRILMYPQLILLALALRKRDTKIASYIIALCAFGLFFSGIHYYEHVYTALYPARESGTLIPCDASGISCKTAPFFHFGYITIPLMAFTAFLLNLLTGLLILKKEKRN